MPFQRLWKFFASRMPETSGFLWVCLLTLAVTPQVEGVEPLVMDLWPGPAAGDQAAPGPDTIVPPKAGEKPPTLRLTQVTRPQIVVFLPPPETSRGAAMLVLPGGGFNHLAFDKEGTEPAEWLAQRGIVGVALKYRCPTKADRATQHIKPLQDAQRAMSLIRARADEWGLDVNRVGVIGFSAGGHLAARLALNSGTRAYAESDPIDQSHWQPDFAALIYPAYLLDPQQATLDVDAFHITSDSPPIFMAYSWDDQLPSPGALHLAIALREANVSCELHQYASGGHAYGLRPADFPASTWPARLDEWLAARGVLAQ